jgi:transcriptional regulator with XRE-family HTH domain
MLTNIFNRDIGIRIKLIRTKKHLNQNDFANNIGIAQGFLSEIERGIKQPSIELVLKIISQYEINPDWLLTGEGTPNKEKETEERDEISEMVLAMLEEMTEEQKRDVLRYTKEKKQMIEMMKKVSELERKAS